MAIQFTPARRANQPDLVGAVAEQGRQANYLRGMEQQASAQRSSDLMQGGLMAAQAAPEGTFTGAWDLASGAQTVGEIAPMVAEEAAIGELMAGAAAQEATLAAGTTAVAETAAAATAAEGLAAGGTAAAGATGMAPAMAALGPLGWTALAGLAASQFF